MKTYIEVRYIKDDNYLGRGEDLRNAVIGSLSEHILEEEFSEDEDSIIYNILYDTKGNAKKALKKTKTYLKNKNWDDNECESDFNKESYAWRIDYYNAVALLEIKDLDSIPEEDRY